MPSSQEERLLDLLRRLRRLGTAFPPIQDMPVTPPQLMLLGWIAEHEGCRVHDVAAGLGLTPPTVSVSLRRLEQLGLLRREPDPNDKRALRLFLTSEGKDLHQRVQTFQHEHARRFLSNLTPAEQETLLTLWTRALEAAENPDATLQRAHRLPTI